MAEHLSDQTVFVLLLAALAFVILALTRLFDWFQRHGSFPAADFWLALFTLALVVETAISLYILDKTDTALHSAALAADDANKLNAVGLRPWVDFDMFDVGAGFIVTADTVNFGAKFSLKNSGRLPALMTNQNFKILPLPAAPGRSNEIADLVLHDQRQVCKGTDYLPVIPSSQDNHSLSHTTF